MTKGEWVRVENALKSMYSFVKLNCDGYEVKLSLQPVSQFKNAIVPFINGTLKGKWIVEDCEERRRFLPCKKKTIVKEKDIKALRSSGLRMTEKRIQEYKDKYSYNVYSAFWTNFRSMKKHLEENNKSIELIEIV